MSDLYKVNSDLATFIVQDSRFTTVSSLSAAMSQLAFSRKCYVGVSFLSKVKTFFFSPYTVRYSTYNTFLKHFLDEISAADFVEHEKQNSFGSANWKKKSVEYRLALEAPSRGNNIKGGRH